MCRKIISIQIEKRNLLSVVAGVVIMGGVLNGVNNLRLNAIVTLMIGFVTGMITYFSVLILMKNEIAIEMMRDILKRYRAQLSATVKSS